MRERLHRVHDASLGKLSGETPWWRAGVAREPKFHSRLETKVVVHHKKYYKDEAGCWHKGKYGVWCPKEDGSWFQESGAGEGQKKSQFGKRFEKLIQKGLKAISKKRADDFLGKKAI